MLHCLDAFGKCQEMERCICCCCYDPASTHWHV